eukprot:9964562-Lingulodinium_polyedra.AAC.1
MLGSYAPGSFLELFGGCGGRTMGYELDGGMWIGVSIESQPACCAVHRDNCRNVCIEHTITVDDPLPSAARRGESVVTCHRRYQNLSAGPPCQPYSVLGKQLGANDLRDGFPALRAAIEMEKPLNVEVENVENLANHPEVLEGFCTFLREQGYYTRVYRIDASRYDVPQRRVRLLVMASLLGSPRAPLPSASHE